MISFEKKGFLESLIVIFLAAMLGSAVAVADPDPRLHPNTDGAFASGLAADSIVRDTAVAQQDPGNVLPVPEPNSTSGQDSEKDKLMSFFVIGIIINLILILAVGVWAYREWQRRK